MAAIELHRATREGQYVEEAIKLGRSLAALQPSGYTGSQKLVRGFWAYGGERPIPFWDPVYAAIPALAMMELITAFPKHAEAARWRDAVRLYMDEYALPMSHR